MKPSSGGNGTGKFEIHNDDMGGWLRVHTDLASQDREDLGVFLSQATTEWFRQRPQYRLKCVSPIVREGRTVELHAWYEVHAFPAIQGPVPQR